MTDISDLVKSTSRGRQDLRCISLIGSQISDFQGGLTRDTLSWDGLRFVSSLLQLIHVTITSSVFKFMHI